MPVFDVDEMSGTSELRLYSGGVALTQYFYSGGTVSLAEIVAPLSLSVDELGRQLDIISQWIGMVADRLSPATSAVGEFDIDMKSRNDKCVGKYKANGTDLTEAKYVWGSGQVTIQPRPAYVMTRAAFRRWIAFYRQFHRDCREA